MNISIIGTGYVGLVTGVCLADKGHAVVCVDVDRDKVNAINRGEVPFHEPGLRELLTKSLKNRFRATDDLNVAVRESDITFIAVGTPFRNRQIDLTYVRMAARQVGRALRSKRRYHVVVVKSTVVPGTTENVVQLVLERASGRRAGTHFGLGMNPEFLSEGNAVADFSRPDRIVLGAIDRRTLEVMDAVYEPFSGVFVLRTSPKTAEMIKYTSNALLASLISFSNEIGNLCVALGGIDAEQVMLGTHMSDYLSHRRGDGARVCAPITAFLRAGCGFGGSCLPKDVKAIIARGEQAGASMRLLRSVIHINDTQPQQMIDLLRRHFRSLRRVPVAVLGLAFKPGTDDLRETPAVPIVQLLRSAGARVRVYDPVAMPAARKSNWFGDVQYVESLQNAIESAAAALIVTAWPEFRQLERISRNTRRSLVVVDGRRLLDRRAFSRYEGIGLGADA